MVREYTDIMLHDTHLKHSSSSGNSSSSSKFISNIYQSNLKHLCVLQNKIVRIIAGVKPRESAGPLYDSLGIMKLTYLNKYLIARFMFRFCINMVPKFSSYFLRNYKVSSYDLRSTNCFHLPLFATDLDKNGIRYR